MKISKLTMIAIILFMPYILIAQSNKPYTYWPVKNAGYNVQAIYGENTISLTSLMHDGLDIYGDNSTIVAARGGTIKFIVTDVINSEYFDPTQGMIILKVPLVDNPDSNNPEHYEYDLYMHITIDRSITKIGIKKDVGETLGTIAPAQGHLHFTRLKYYVQKNENTIIEGYDYAGKNALNPLLNFSTDVHKDPTLKIPALQKYNEQPSIFFKRNLYRTKVQFLA